jgi:hypothetical protein
MSRHQFHGIFRAILIISLYLTPYTSHADALRSSGVGLALGGGPGIGLMGFYNINDKIQIRPCIGMDVAFSDGYRKRESGGDTLDALADDVHVTLQGRYYFHPNLYVGSGITYSFRYLKAEKDIYFADSLSNVDLSLAYKVDALGTAVFLGHEWVSALSLPIKIGAEFGRNSVMGGYIEAGYLLQTFPWEQTVIFPIKTGAIDYVAKYKSGWGHILLGVGVTIKIER